MTFLVFNGGVNIFEGVTEKQNVVLKLLPSNLPYCIRFIDFDTTLCGNDPQNLSQW